MDEIRSNGARERSEARSTEPRRDGPRRAEPRRTGPPSYRFARRPKWLAAHVLVVVFAVLFVNLGFWQLRRLDERKDLNARVEANAQATPQPLPVNLSDADVDELEWHPVSIEGTYRPDSDVLVANRSVNQQPGFWLVTPLERADGGPAVAVVRGFVTRVFVREGDLAELRPPSGTVQVTGYVQESQSGGRFATGLPDDVLPEVTRTDVDALSQQWGIELAPLWIQLASQQPDVASAALAVVPLPDLSEGSHLSYAVQWFLFATVAVVGYAVVLHRNARSETAAPPR